MTDVVSVYALFANEEEAKVIGGQMVEERLAACVNILAACHSIYWWEGTIHQAGETPALFKTNEGAADDLIRRIVELHSYDQPVAVAWPAAHVPEGVRAWIAENVQR